MDEELRFLDLIWLLNMTHAQYLERFRGTAIRRAKHWMLQRNAAVVLGNVGPADALPHLIEAMRTNPHPIVRGHAAWAIGHMGVRLNLLQAKDALREALATEDDPTVVEEVHLALEDLQTLT